MKKLAALVAMCLISVQAFAAPVYTVTSTEKYRDAQGNNKIRVEGTIAFDSSYDCNSSTKICGEAINASNLGLSTLSRLSIMPAFSNVAGGLILFNYHSEGLTSNGGAGLEGPNVRVYLTQSVSAVGSSALVSAPSYNLSALTAVPFSAVGS